MARANWLPNAAVGGAFLKLRQALVEPGGAMAQGDLADKGNASAHASVRVARSGVICVRPETGTRILRHSERPPKWGSG